MAELHKYLTGFDKYTKPLPFYVDSLFTSDQDKRIRDLIETNRQIEPFVIGDRIEDGYIDRKSVV